MEEFVLKTRRKPLRIKGLVDKGHPNIGVDADVSAVDLDRLQSAMSIING